MGVHCFEKTGGLMLFNHFVPHTLLEKLAMKAGCGYLSDFHAPIYAPDVYTAAATLQNPQDYTLKEWNDAVHYITGRHVTYRSAQQAHDALLSYLSKAQGFH